MKAKTNTTKKTQSKAFQVGTRDHLVLVSVPYTVEDFKNSLLIVSLAINAFILTLWITTMVSAQYASAVALAILG